MEALQLPLTLLNLMAVAFLPNTEDEEDWMSCCWSPGENDCSNTHAVCTFKVFFFSSVLFYFQ